MANTSDWKGFEKFIARALGGKRRFRTTENYGKIADDILFKKETKKTFPVLKTIAVECKKRKSIGIHKTFEKTRGKYGKTGKRIILASKITRKKSTALVTVDINFFKELWYSWLWKTVRRFPRTGRKK